MSNSSLLSGSGSPRHDLRYLAPLRTTDLNHAGMSLQERIDVFTSIWGRFYEIDFARPKHFVGVGRAWEVGDTLAGYATLGDVSLRFDPKATHYDADQLLLSLDLSGESVGTDDPHPFGAGWISLTSFARSWSRTYRGYDYFGAFLPRQAVGFDPSVHGEIRLHSETPAGRVLKTAILAFAARLPHATAAEAPKLASDLAEIVRSTMLKPQGRASGPVLHRARRMAIQHFIDKHLSDPSLSPERLSRVFGLSRASLYRLFAEFGGVRLYIRDRRMLSCLRVLATSEGRRGQVRRVAEAWGFTDPGTFSRDFRRRFGLKPSDVAQADRGILHLPPPRPPPPDAPLVINRFAEWLPDRPILPR